MKTRYKWTVEDYHQLVETGILAGKPVELYWLLVINKFCMGT